MALLSTVLRGGAAAAGVGLLAWACISLATGRRSVEHARFALVSRHRAARDGLAFELRRYAPSIKARVLVSARNLREATSRGFRDIAKFIFGGNAARKSVAMTSPVVTAPLRGGSEAIAMTAPVVSQAVGGDGDGEGGRFEIAFVMPSTFERVEELPEPLDRAVELVAMPPRFEVVHAFHGGYPSEAAVRHIARSLLAGLRDAGLTPAPVPEGGGTFVEGTEVVLKAYAFDPPWVIPFLKLNEIAIEVVAPAPQ